MRDKPLFVVRLMVAVIIGLGGITLRMRYINGCISMNESQTRALMNHLCSAQGQVQASGAIDMDGGGDGEYAFLGELMGTAGVRGTAQRIGTALLSNTELRPVGKGIYQLEGYYIRVYLPGEDGIPCIEPGPRDKNQPTRVDAHLSARHWWAHAWPVEYGATGNRCFYVSSAGDVLSTYNRDGQYLGLERRPAADALNDPGSSSPPPWGILIKEPARDGMRWHVV